MSARHETEGGHAAALAVLQRVAPHLPEAEQTAVFADVTAIVIAAFHLRDRRLAHDAQRVG